ncbi:MAG: helix-hairpin-helix domain-containing protein [Candidatus Brocadiae bacterium]|nr:helix-hairpin-helix domain-containing protein [Candidatus Brocadiia bacterium]
MEKQTAKIFLCFLLLIVFIQAIYSFIKAKPTPPPLESIRISLNQAKLSELQILPGLGKERAYKIYCYRLDKGFFHDSQDLLEIHGIGGTVLKKIEKFITIQPSF